MATSRSILMDSWLTPLRAAVRKRCTSTWSSSATSILASPPPPVSLPQPSIYDSSIALTYITGHLIYKCGGIDKRTIEKFEKVRIPPRRRLCTHFLPYRDFAPRWGKVASHNQQFFATGHFWRGNQRCLLPKIHLISTRHQISLVQLLTRSKGSRRVGQGFFQVCVGS